MKDEAAAGRRGVDRLGNGAEPDAAFFERRYRIDEMWQRAAEAIQFPDDQHVTIAGVFECRP
jgi:hypothetical protein